MFKLYIQYSMYCMDGMVVWVHPSVQNEVVSFGKVKLRIIQVCTSPVWTC